MANLVLGTCKRSAVTCAWVAPVSSGNTWEPGGRVLNESDDISARNLCPDHKATPAGMWDFGHLHCLCEPQLSHPANGNQDLDQGAALWHQRGDISACVQHAGAVDGGQEMGRQWFCPSGRAGRARPISEAFPPLPRAASCQTAWASWQVLINEYYKQQTTQKA